LSPDFPVAEDGQRANVARIESKKPLLADTVANW
jgi:hypothetical protein